MYEAGTLVLFDRRGVYQIESIGEPPLSVSDEVLYYKLCSAFSGSGEIIYIPVNTTVFMRPLISESQVLEYLELSLQMEPQVFSSRRAADLIAHYRSLLASYKLEDCLLLIKEIYLKQRDITGRGKRLGQVDQEYLKLAERLVCEEFAAVLGTTPDVVKKKLYASMRRKAAPQKAAP